MWVIVLKYALGLLGELAVLFLRDLIEQKATDPQLMRVAESIVRRIERRPHGLTGSAKARVARANIRLQLPEITKNMKDSALNGIIELMVHKFDHDESIKIKSLMKLK